jgi:hypothetical protein
VSAAIGRNEQNGADDGTLYDADVALALRDPAPGRLDVLMRREIAEAHRGKRSVGAMEHRREPLEGITEVNRTNLHGSSTA